MCGFVMILSADNRPADAALSNRMAALMAHRGPDDTGQFSEHGLAFAFRRLAIFDLSDSSRQPMISADGRYVIVFNGAIYNFIELRAELIDLGHKFRTDGDTEVLLASYQQWGAACLSRLNGMWAFVVYDRRDRRIFAARDRFGVKPLFWYYDARGLVLTSEIKAIRDSGYASTVPNWRTIARFLLEARLDEDDTTFYTGIRRVPAGTFFEGDARIAPTFRRYWCLDEAIAMAEPPDPVEQFRYLFDDAVRVRMRGDVPVGVLLSGGLDSTSIISRMVTQQYQNGPHTRRIEALSYVDPAYDEAPFIDATLRQTGAALHRLEADPEQLWNILERHLWYQDEPVHSFTSVVIYQLMQLAREHGLKVMLSGQGADEVLAGYPAYFIDYWSDLVRSGHPWIAHGEIDAFARGHEQSPLALHGALARRYFNYWKRRVPGYRRLAALRRRARIMSDQWVSDDVKLHWEPSQLPYPHTLTDSLRMSVERFALPLYLRIEDRNAMAHGVEVRMPFLDHRLVSLAFRLGARRKLHGEYTKVVLREAMEGRIPEVVRKRVSKFGFPTSANSWLRTTLLQHCKDVLSSRATRESGVWNIAVIHRALDRHKGGSEDLGGRLFDVVEFAMWFRMSGFGLLLHLLPLIVQQLAEITSS